MSFLKVLIRNVLSGPSTDPFPFGDTFTPEKYRGRVEYDASKCNSCKICERVCAAGAIRFDTTEKGKRFMLWHNSCMYCGMCAFHCTRGALTMTNDWLLAHRQEKKYQMVEHGLIPLVACADCGKEFYATPPNAKPFGKVTPTEDELEGLRHFCVKCRRKEAERLIALRPETDLLPQEEAASEDINEGAA